MRSTPSPALATLLFLRPSHSLSSQGYTARTDNCAVGGESGCCVGSGCSTSTNKPLTFQIRPTDTPPFSNLAHSDTGATDPDFHSHLIMVTDQGTNNTSTTYNMAEDNDNTDAFAIDSSMFFILFNGGGPYFYYLNSTYARANACANSDLWPNACLLKSQIVGGTTGLTCATKCTIVQIRPNTTFSRVSGETNVIYERAADGVTINKLTICRSNSSDSICSSTPVDTFTRTQYAKFNDTTGCPSACVGVLPANYNSLWQGTLGISDDGSITVGSAGAAPWAATTGYTTPDSFIYPAHTNSGKNAFQAIASGTSSGSEPNWDSTCPNIYPATGSTCADGGVTWANIGHLSGQGPAFDILNYRPSVGGYSRVNTRILKVYRGAGVSDPSGAITTDDSLVCSQYGLALNGGMTACSVAAPFTETFTMHGIAGLANSAYVTTTPTGGGSAPPGQNYSPATTPMCLPDNSNYRGAWVSGLSGGYANHDAVYDPSHPQNLYVSKVNANSAPLSTTANWAGNLDPAGPVYCYKYVWQVNSTTFRPCMMRGVSGNFDEGRCPGHEVHGYLNFWGDALGYSHLWSQPTIGGAANAGTQILPSPNGIPGDEHGTYRNSGTADTNPVGEANTDVPTTTYAVINAANPQMSAGYGEFVAIKTDGSANSPPCTTTGKGCFYRFAHNFNDGIENDFAAQNNISAISQDGQWVLIPTDMMGTRGSRSPAWAATTSYPIGTPLFPTNHNSLNYDFVATAIGGSTAAGGTGTSGGTEPHWNNCTTTCLDPPTCSGGGCATQITWTRQAGSCNQYRSAGARYAPGPVSMNAGDLMFPVGANDIFQAQNSGATSGTIPSWQTTCGSYGQSCTYGTVSLVNIGPSDCRADIMLVDLESAH